MSRRDDIIGTGFHNRIKTYAIAYRLKTEMLEAWDNSIRYGSPDYAYEYITRHNRMTEFNSSKAYDTMRHLLHANHLPIVARAEAIARLSRYIMENDPTR